RLQLEPHLLSMAHVPCSVWNASLTVEDGRIAGETHDRARVKGDGQPTAKSIAHNVWIVNSRIRC
ncbi:MAG: hypothetical protein JXA09_18305, partial [Anaerolineae bacterium]|nr:hypothetical protein [Anaerolineae bacterium]